MTLSDAAAPLVTTAARAPRAALVYLLEESLLLLCFAYLLLFAGTSQGVVDPGRLRASLGLLTVCVVGWSVSLLRHPPATAPARPWHPLSIASAVFLGAYLLTALTSIDPRRSLVEVGLAASYAFAFALAWRLAAGGLPRELLAKVLLLVGALVLGLTCYTALRWYQQWLAAAPGQWLPSVAYRLPAPNILSTFLNYLLMLALARLAATPGGLPRVLLVAWVLAGLGALYLTSSRGGWLGTAAGLAVVAALTLLSSRYWASWRTRLLAMARRPAVLAGLAALCLVGLAALGYLGLGLLRSVEAHPTHGPITGSRTEFWLPALETFRQHPLVGQGPYTYGSTYVRSHSVPPALMFFHAHAVWANLLAETGLTGTLACLAWLAAVVWTFRQRWRERLALAPLDRAVLVGAAGAFAAGAGHGLVEVITSEPSNGLLLALVLGAGLAPAVATPSHAAIGSPPAWQRLGRWTGPILGALLLAGGVWLMWAQAPLEAAVQASVEGNWPAALGLLRQAAQRDPSAAVAQQWGVAASVLAAEAPAGSAERQALLAEAVTALERAASGDPDWPINHTNLGVLYAETGQTGAALEQLRQAAALARQAPIHVLNLGLVAEAAGQAAEAGAAYEQTLALRRDWAESYFFRATPFRRDWLAGWRQTHPAAPAPEPAALAEAAAGAGGQFAINLARLAQARLEAGQVDAADRLLRQAQLAYFYTTEERLVVQWLQAEVLAAQGETAGAAELAGPLVSAFQYQSIFGPGMFGGSPYGPFMYRQLLTPVDLVPQLSLIRFTDTWAQRFVTLGGWYEALGRLGEARQVYAAVLAEVPDNAAAASRLAALGGAPED